VHRALPAARRVLIGTGARISEALAVRWPDADLDTGVVRPTIG